MKVLRATQSSIEVLLFSLFALGSLFAQPTAKRSLDTAPTASSAGPAVQSTVRVFPRVHLPAGIDLTYLGMFSPDALFHAPSRFGGESAEAPGESIVPASSPSGQAGHGDVPQWMLLSSERIVENVEPPARAKAVPSMDSTPAHLRNHAVTFMYGHPSVILAPRYIVTDSQQRLILSDPRGSAVHVLDPRGKTSFRLVCGKGYRVHKPAGVATDADDNIYVADSEHGMLAVFDSSGNFLRYIGSYQGEPEYASPQGIAIDIKLRHLFVVDTPRNQVFELDLEGKLIKRFGKNHKGVGTGDLDSPTDITLNHQHIFILDRAGTRVQVVNMDLEPVRSFDIARLRDPQLTRDNGMGTDQEGNVYVSFYRGSKVRVYSTQGELLATFGQFGTRAGQFAEPRGLWINARNQLYVADSGNGRVQMFQLESGQ